MEEYVTRWSLFHVQSVEDYWKYWKQSKIQMIMNRNVIFARNYNLRDFSYWVCLKIKNFHIEKSALILIFPAKSSGCIDVADRCYLLLLEDWLCWWPISDIVDQYFAFQKSLAKWFCHHHHCHRIILNRTISPKIHFGYGLWNAATFKSGFIA